MCEMVWFFHIINNPDALNFNLNVWMKSRYAKILGNQHCISSLSYHSTILNSQPSSSLYPSINQSVIRSFLQASEQMGSCLLCCPRCVCGISCHQVRKAKKVEKWKEWERPEQTKIGRRWINGSIHLCKKEKKFTRDLWRRFQRWNRKPQRPPSLWQQPQRGMRPLQMH